MRDAIKEIDPARLVTASHGGDISREELADYLRVARVDFITPHRPRNGASPAGTQTKTQEYLQWMAELGKIVPVHYQEPFRRDYGRWQPELADFVADLRGAITGGAAGWCLHNGSPRGAARDDTGPRRSFDLSERCLMAQLDAVELAVLGEMSRALDYAPGPPPSSSTSRSSKYSTISLSASARISTTISIGGPSCT